METNPTSTEVAISTVGSLLFAVALLWMAYADEQAGGPVRAWPWILCLVLAVAVTLLALLAFKEEPDEGQRDALIGMGAGIFGGLGFTLAGRWLSARNTSTTSPPKTISPVPVALGTLALLAVSGVATGVVIVVTGP